MSDDTTPAVSKKRKVDETELEIDVNAPEPPSKKALRKAKKVKESGGPVIPVASAPTTEEPDLRHLNGLEGDRSKFGVWIGNLSFTTAKKDLYKFLITNPDHAIPEDKITRIHMPAGTDTRSQNRGFAYVDFVNQDLVQTALQLSESLLSGRRLLIKDATNFEGRPESSKAKPEVPSKPPNRKIFVGNLAFDITIEEIEKHFGVCGPIVRTNLAEFPDSGRCKGYGWIEFEKLSAAETAMRGWTEIDHSRTLRDGTEVDGKKKIWLMRMGERKLRMEYAEDSTTRYNKRFGKNAKPGDGDEDDEPSKPTRQSKQSQSKQSGSKYRPRESRKDFKEKKYSDSRYDEKTVQKMKGAIVDGKGSKVTFD